MNRQLVTIALVLADLYMLWTVLRAPSAGRISTKWGWVDRAAKPRRFWTTFGLQLALAALLFPVLIAKFAMGSDR